MSRVTARQGLVIGPHLAKRPMWITGDRFGSDDAGRLEPRKGTRRRGHRPGGSSQSSRTRAGLSSSLLTYAAAPDVTASGGRSASSYVEHRNTTVSGFW